MTNTANTPAETKTAPKAKAETPCQCARFSNAETGEATGCTKSTTRDFSPGHDAKLKSLAIRAGAAGQRLERLDDGEPVVLDAVKAVEGYGFAHMVQAGIERAARLAEAKAAKAKEKAERAATRAAAKAAAKQEQATADQPETVKAKVGRATYEGRIEGDEFVYEVKGAERRTTKHELV
ncbi:hypothetical protein ACFW53_02390 [Nocardiopsis dassonvillei]|uniref:hypothetical protein n=1 Tax=Nocardiopsis dassonvillei TaxID=2014 RepID=UPI003672D347